MCRSCAHCEKPLVRIGRSRKNGKGNYDDWATRMFHKKCVKYAECFYCKKKTTKLDYNYVDNEDKYRYFCDEPCYYNFRDTLCHACGKEYTIKYYNSNNGEWYCDRGCHQNHRRVIQQTVENLNRYFRL